MGRGALVVAVIALGCQAPTVLLEPADTGASADASVDADPIDPAFDRVALAYCKVTAKCQPVSIVTDWGGYEECLKRYPRFGYKLFRGYGVAMTSAQFAACADARETEDCAKAEREWLERNPPAICRVPGTLKAGTPCANDFQCATLHCGGTCGLCVEPLAEGAACAVDAQCDFGQLCRGRKCVRPHDVGEACDATTPCHFDLACRSGTCVKAARLDEACLADADPPCVINENLRCDAVTNKCVRIGVANVGEACNVDGSACAHGATCRTPELSKPGQCILARPDGAACGNIPYSSPGGACTYPSTCWNGICREIEADDCNVPGGAP